MNLSQCLFQSTADVIMLKQQVNKSAIAFFLGSLKYLSGKKNLHGSSKFMMSGDNVNHCPLSLQNLVLLNSLKMVCKNFGFLMARKRLFLHASQRGQFKFISWISSYDIQKFPPQFLNWLLRGSWWVANYLLQF